MNNFSSSPYNNPYAGGAQSVAGQNSLIQRVSYLLCTTLLVTAATAWWAGNAGLSPALFLPLSIGTIGCVIALSFTRTKPALSLGLLYLLSVLEGLLMGPLLMSIARGYPFGAAVIGEAALLSAVIVAGLGSYVWISGKDFGGIGKYLIFALIGLLVVGLVRFFVAFSPGVNLLYAFVGAAIFVGFTLYDFSNIKFRYGPNDYSDCDGRIVPGLPEPVLVPGADPAVAVRRRLLAAELERRTVISPGLRTGAFFGRSRAALR